MKRVRPSYGTPTTIRFKDEIEKQIEVASKKLGLAKVDVIRLACAVGLEDLRRVNYDVAGAIVDRKQQAQDHCATLLRAAEEPPVYVGKQQAG